MQNSPSAKSGLQRKQLRYLAQNSFFKLIHGIDSMDAKRSRQIPISDSIYTKVWFSVDTL